MIKNILRNKDLAAGYKEIVQNVKEFKYPIKVVISIGNNNVTVITCYPLKKRRKI